MHDFGDDNTPSDDVQYRLGYHVNPGDTHRCVGVSRVEAMPESGEPLAGLFFPTREAIYGDVAHCYATSVRDLVSGGMQPGGAAPYSNAWLETIIALDQYGTLMGVRDPSGYLVGYTRDPVLHQNVIATHDSLGYESTADWDLALGTQTSTTDINGQKQAFRFDGLGRLVAVYAPGDPKTGNDASDATVTFEYHLPRPATPGDYARAVTHHRSLPGERPIDTSTFMDGLGRVFETKRTALVDVSGSPVPGMTVSGAVNYDSRGRVIERGQPWFTLGGPEVPGLGPMTNATRIRYDGFSRVTRTEYPSDTDAMNVTSTDYRMASGAVMLDPPPGMPAMVEMIVATDQLGRQRTTLRDASGRTRRVVEHNHVDGGTGSEALYTDYLYDLLGRLTTVRERGAARVDHPLAAHETTVAYDSLGRRTHIVSPDTGDTEYRFDARGNLAERITPNLRTGGAPDGRGSRGAIAYAYDDGGRLTRITYPDLADGTAQVPTVLTYGGPRAAGNGAGRVTSRSDESGLTVFRYGALGETTVSSRLLIDPDRPSSPASPRYIRDAAGRDIVFATFTDYDRFGRMRSITYPNRERVTYGYDLGGALTSVGTNRLGGQGYVDRILYDAFGQRTQITYGNHVTTRYAYTDRLRHLATLHTEAPMIVGRRTTPGSTLTLQNLTYAYALNGNITDVVDAPEITGGDRLATMRQHFEYDDLDQLQTANGHYDTSAGTQGTPIWSGGRQRTYTASFRYDDLGRMTHNQLQDVVITPATGVG
ncbi:MAG: hypothetical protein WCJ30_16680, partial [Deltaproteobacteria bacterium]